MEKLTEEPRSVLNLLEAVTGLELDGSTAQGQIQIVQKNLVQLNSGILVVFELIVSELIVCTKKLSKTFDSFRILFFVW